MQARFAGACSVCGSPIALGDDISPYRWGWVHARCAPDGGVLAPAFAPAFAPLGWEVVCSECFLIHPAGACDL